ncbi:Kinesin-like protein KIN-5D [Linum grandiflorum]
MFSSRKLLQDGGSHNRTSPMEHSHSQQLRRSTSMIPVSPPSHTPRTSQRGLRDSASLDGNSSNSKNDKGVNVQVLLRCRPLNQDEKQLVSPAVISCNEKKGIVTLIQNTAHKQIDKNYQFDKVFGPTCEQKLLFDSAVTPIVNEVLEGYNCTIFAYGQTGTGKTYTMEGGMVAEDGEFPSDAGIIPRAVQQIFEVLEARSEDYSMKVTFLELYNEEIMDLLDPDESPTSSDEKPKKPIALLEDGKGGVFIRGLEQELVSSAKEIYKILEKGSARRQTAATLLNKTSSRSHTIFSITISIKEDGSALGEELVKCGKLNLVDLAGSENISRSGAKEERAREAGEINKSLLTLGRVINALVDHSGHVPYRDSKLTRLLRDSLGGKTKTCIIATISPSVHSLEETLNTLDYAHRAKNIKNRPEASSQLTLYLPCSCLVLKSIQLIVAVFINQVNQRTVKAELLKDLYADIDRLRQELHAAREKNGIYIPVNRYRTEEAERKALAEKVEFMQLELDLKDKQLMEVQSLSDNQQHQIAELGGKLQKTQNELQETHRTMLDMEARQRKALAVIKERECLISNLLQSEKALTDQALTLRDELEGAAKEASNFFEKIEAQTKLGEANRLLLRNYQSQVAQELEGLHRIVTSAVAKQEQQLKSMEKDLSLFLADKEGATEGLLSEVARFKNSHDSSIKTVENLATELDGGYQLALSGVTSEVERNSSCLVEAKKYVQLVEEKFMQIQGVLQDIQTDLSNEDEKLAEYAQQQHEAHSKTLKMTKTISEAIMSFTGKLSMHSSNLSRIAEETQITTGEKLYQLEKEFELNAALEKDLLLEKIAELLDSSNARKKKLVNFYSAFLHVQTSISSLLESMASGNCNLQLELSTLENVASSVKSEWRSHLEITEGNHVEAAGSVKNGKMDLEELLHQCLTKASTGAVNCKDACESVLNQQKRSLDSVFAIAGNGIETNQDIFKKLTSVASSTLQESDSANQSLISAISNLLKLDHEVEKNMNKTITPSIDDIKKLNRDHLDGVLQIKENTSQCLISEYKVDDTCISLTKEKYSIPSSSTIQELRTPDFEALVSSFSTNSAAEQELESKTSSVAQTSDLNLRPTPEVPLISIM